MAQAAREARTEPRVSKRDSFSEWYTQSLLRAEILDYSDISGCYILRPWGYSIWSHLQSYLKGELGRRGVKDAYFPLLITEGALAREREHVAGFAPEVAWVTHAGSAPLNVRLAIRPTSETAMYPAYARWIQSHRDLPLRLNQWCNVVRWEFQNPQPFIRSREFLWQEGHSAFATQREADEEVRDMLMLYKQVYEEVLAVPVIAGVKSASEKFAGADRTLTVEAFVPETGRAIQAATSHSLGQNFSRIFDIKFETELGMLQHVWQNSWGFTTRSVGIALMTHGDDRGLVLPPRAAETQAIIVPVGINAQTDPLTAEQIRSRCREIASLLRGQGVRAEADLADHQTAGWKFCYWERKGVPLRLEVGPQELASDTISIASRLDEGRRVVSPRSAVAAAVETRLASIQAELLARAQSRLSSSIVECDSWQSFVDTIIGGKMGLIAWCEGAGCEVLFREKIIQAHPAATGVKSLCIPFDQPGRPPARCLACDTFASQYALFGRSF